MISDMICTPCVDAPGLALERIGSNGNISTQNSFAKRTRSMAHPYTISKSMLVCTCTCSYEQKTKDLRRRDVLMHTCMEFKERETLDSSGCPVHTYTHKARRIPKYIHKIY